MFLGKNVQHPVRCFLQSRRIKIRAVANFSIDSKFDNYELLTDDILFICAISVAIKVVTYPAGSGVETLEDFSVEMCQDSGQWLPIDVYPVKVDRVDRKGYNVELPP